MSEALRSAVLTLASHTGWSLAELESLPLSELHFWLLGLPKRDA